MNILVVIVGLMGTFISNISEQFENVTCWMLVVCPRRPSINNQQYDSIMVMFLRR